MHPQATSATGPFCVASGYGLKICVHHGHLIVHDGICDERETRRYNRATSKLQRLVLIGHSGYVTLEALRWLYDVGASLIHIGSDGKLITISVPADPGNASLRRAQALARDSQVGTEIARYLIGEKIAGQLAVCRRLDGQERAVGFIEFARSGIPGAPNLQTLVSLEAEAASAYWRAWAAIPVRFASRDQSVVPEHWRSFGGRHSPLSTKTSRAVNPANAILNYLYALVEAETMIACQTLDLDPLLGIFHTDQRNRKSLVLDVMEPVRPDVDAHVLQLLQTETWSRRDFHETRDGSCRLSPHLARQLAQTLLSWRSHVAPIVERVASMLAASAQTAAPAPLTQAYRRAVQASPTESVRRSVPALLLNSCRDCGAGVPDRRRRYCAACRAERVRTHANEVRTNLANRLVSTQPTQRSPRANLNANPVQQPANGRGIKNAQHQRARREWTGPPADPDLFKTEIWPHIRELDDDALASATGLSGYYCSLIRLGKRVPHSRHWDALRAMRG